jgi:hypothetical protein
LKELKKEKSLLLGDLKKREKREKKLTRDLDKAKK